MTCHAGVWCEECVVPTNRRWWQQEIMAFNTWLGSLPHAHKVCVGSARRRIGAASLSTAGMQVVVAGNHDLLFDSSYYNANWRQWTPVKEDCHADTARNLLTNATHYLEHEEASVIRAGDLCAPFISRQLPCVAFVVGSTTGGSRWAAHFRQPLPAVSQGA